MGMVAFYAGLIMGTLVGIVCTVLLSRLAFRAEIPKGGTNPVEL